MNVLLVFECSVFVDVLNGVVVVLFVLIVVFVLVVNVGGSVRSFLFGFVLVVLFI